MITLTELESFGFDSAVKNCVDCKICNSPSALYDVVDYNKAICDSQYLNKTLAGVPVFYYRCLNCEFIFTKSFDNFSSGGWQKFIYNDDYFKQLDAEYEFERPNLQASLLKSLIGSKTSFYKGLDYGGGNGRYAQILTQHGIDFKGFDPFDYSDLEENSKNSFNIVTCFEVLEHTTTPIDTIIS